MQHFNSFLQSLFGDSNPKGGMMGGGGNQTNRQFYDQAGNDAYYQNPYRMQDSIDAGMLKRKEADAAMAAAMGQQMPQNNGGGSDGYGNGLTPDQIAFLDAETLDQRGARIKDDFAKLFNPIPSLVGMLSGPTRGVVNAPITNLDTYSPAAAQAASSNAISAAQASQQAQAQHGINSTQAQAAQAAQAQANAAANAAAISAAQSSGSSSDFGGDLGTGASDAAGYGGYGGVW
jgi:hypothetical protein